MANDYNYNDVFCECLDDSTLDAIAQCLLVPGEPETEKALRHAMNCLICLEAIANGARYYGNDNIDRVYPQLKGIWDCFCYDNP